MLVNLQLLLLDITSSLLTTTLTYTLAPYTGSTATTTLGIGSSTPKGWDASTAMAKSTFDAHSWTLGVTIK
jgi:hypothetical protein